MIGGGGRVGGGGVLSLSFSFPSALCAAVSGPAVLQNDDADRQGGRETGRKRGRRKVEASESNQRKREMDR